MENTDTQAEINTQGNTELIKSIMVGMAVETSIATLQGMNPAKVYKAIDISANESTGFIISCLKKERQDGVSEGKKDFKKRSREQMKFYLDAFNMKNKEAKVDTEKIMNFADGKGVVEIKCGTGEKIHDNSIVDCKKIKQCPYCDEGGFDGMQLKNHLEYKCGNYINQKEV